MPEWALQAVDEGDGSVFPEEAVSEDCLFLDVIVSEDILNGSETGTRELGKSSPQSM